MVPGDDIEAIKRRNEEMQRRLQEELAKLKPSEIPPPPSAFANAIDAALSSTPLDQLTPDFGIPITSEEAVAPASPAPTKAPIPPAAEFSFGEVEEVATVNPTIPDEFGIPTTPFFTEEKVPETAATTPTAIPTQPAAEEDFFADLPSAWGAAAVPVEPKPEKPETTPVVKPVTEEVEAFTPAEEPATPIVEEEAVEVSEAQPEPVYGWEPSKAEVTPAPEFKIPVEEFVIPTVEEPEPVAPEPETEFVPVVPEPEFVKAETPTPEVPFFIPKPAAEELPRVIVAQDKDHLRWGRVGIETEEEAIELLERAIAIYRLKHPKP